MRGAAGTQGWARGSPCREGSRGHSKQAATITAAPTAAQALAFICPTAALGAPPRCKAALLHPAAPARGGGRSAVHPEPQQQLRDAWLCLSLYAICVCQQCCSSRSALSTLANGLSHSTACSEAPNIPTPHSLSPGCPRSHTAWLPVTRSSPQPHVRATPRASPPTPPLHVPAAPDAHCRAAPPPKRPTEPTLRHLPGPAQTAGLPTPSPPRRCPSCGPPAQAALQSPHQPRLEKSLNPPGQRQR